MKPKNVLSFPREAWVIPNGHGQLWTDRIFDDEAEAQAQIDQVWEQFQLAGPKHRPVKASVRVTAKPTPLPDTHPQTAGGKDG